jgi:phage terminase Nu1 subunit (DNA packaging protein)
MVTTAQAAQIYGVSIRRIAQLVETGELTRAKAGHVSCESLGQLIKRDRDKLSAPSASYEEDEARKMKADADMAELKTGRAAGELVLAKPLQRAMEEAITVAVEKLVAIGAKVAPLVILERKPKPAADIIVKAIRAACEELCEMDVGKVSSALNEPQNE